MTKRIILMVCCVVCLARPVAAQINYGTTGLMNMPTADMQEDKTFMLGGSWQNHHAMVPEFTYDAWTYHINITFFPWLEVAYFCKGNKGEEYYYGGGTGYWPEETWGKWVNQDRSFHIKLRLWKEGWWKPWTPQIAIGVNDFETGLWQGGSFAMTTNDKNRFLNRYYVAVSKNFEFKGIGKLGTHVAWIYRHRSDHHFSAPAAGANFTFGMDGEGNAFNRFLNGVTLMAEVLPGYTEAKDFAFDEDGPLYQANIGLQYTCWRDHINAVFELNRFKYVSVALYFKIHLK